MEGYEGERTSDELSLVDLAAVLIRWRRLIFASVVLALIASGAWMAFTATGLGRRAAWEPYEATVNAGVSAGVSLLLGASRSESALIGLLADPVYLSRALRKADVTSVNGVDLAGLDEARRLYAVRELMIRGRELSGATMPEDRRPFAVKPEKGLVRISFKHEDHEAALRFVRAALAEANDGLLSLTRPLAEAQIESYERISSKALTSEPEDEILARGFMLYSAALRLSSGKEPAIAAIYEPYAVEPSRGGGLGRSGGWNVLALAAFGAAMVGVALAFVADYARTIKRDERALRKLRDAWKG